jgi:hypothetical protein
MASITLVELSHGTGCVHPQQGFEGDATSTLATSVLQPAAKNASNTTTEAGTGTRTVGLAWLMGKPHPAAERPASPGRRQ